jgi:hypothetical protein
MFALGLKSVQLSSIGWTGFSGSFWTVGHFGQVSSPIGIGGQSGQSGHFGQLNNQSNLLKY